MHLFKTTEISTPNVNPNINYDWVTIMCQCMYLYCNKCTTAGTVGNVGSYSCVGVEDIQEISATYALKSKSSLKTQAYF